MIKGLQSIMQTELCVVVPNPSSVSKNKRLQFVTVITRSSTDTDLVLELTSPFNIHAITIFMTVRAELILNERGS